MSRYIDAEKIKYTEYINGDVTVSKDLVEKIPTADVQEVRHGRWIEKDLDNSRKVEYACSICGWSGIKNYDSYVDIHDFEFCPYCGAKMDEEEQQ